MDTPNLVVYIIVGGLAVIVIIAISYYWFRWIFSIKKQLWNQQQQINLLIKIAEKLGVNDDSEVKTIRYLNNEKSA